LDTVFKYYTAISLTYNKKGAPLIDIKPLFAKFDIRTNTIFGCLNDQETIPSKELLSDERDKLKYL
jgi:tRNA (Thr-GGU) A37 N-methylase